LVGVYGLYKKEKIDALFLRYSRHKDGRVLRGLIQECSPIIDIILAKRYKGSIRHFEDIKQEVKLKMWKNLRRRSRENLRSERCSKNPTAYLYFLIRAYVAKAFGRLKKIYKEDIEMTSSDEEIEGSSSGETGV